MPRCKNCPPPPHKGCYYTGNENTPLGRGFVARYEQEGKRMEGGDGQFWTVSNGRWVKKNRNSNPRGWMMAGYNPSLETIPEDHDGSVKRIGFRSPGRLDYTEKMRQTAKIIKQNMEKYRNLYNFFVAELGDQKVLDGSMTRYQYLTRLATQVKQTRSQGALTIFNRNVHIYATDFIENLDSEQQEDLGIRDDNIRDTATRLTVDLSKQLLSS